MPPRYCHRDALAWLLAGPALLLLAGAAPGQERPRRPNVVVFLVDDMGWADAGCCGSTFYQTPNIDRLARTGLRFTAGYAACPVCSPTRAALLTGKYPARLNITNYFVGLRKGRLLPPEYRHELPLGEFTLAEALRAAGYRTGFFGKWHLGGVGFGPTAQGFDVNVGGNHRGSPPSYFSPYRNPDVPDGPPGEHLGDRLTTEALRFIEKERDRPFFAYLSFYDVHIPLQAKKGLVEKYRARAEKLPETGPRFRPEGDKECRQVQDHPVYAAMVETLDANVGRVLDRLDGLGLADNTIVIFTSDNGGLSTAEGLPTSNLPLRAGKGWLYEGGVRVPLLVRWPGVTRPGGTTDVPAVSTDLYPTLLEAAGLPPRPTQHVDGVSLVPLLRGGPLPERALFWHYPHYSNQGGRPGGSVRLGEYVLIEHYEDGRVELFDVTKDLGQRHDLAAALPERAAGLRRRLADWRQAVGARMPTPDPTWQEGKRK